MKKTVQFAAAVFFSVAFYIATALAADPPATVPSAAPASPREAPAAAAIPPLPGPIAELMAKGSYAEAETLARATWDEMRTNGRDGTPEAIPVLDALVESRWRGGKAQEPETRAFAETAVDLKRRLLGPESAPLARSLNDLAVIAFYVGDYGRARPLWEQAIALREKFLGDIHPDVGDSVNGLANLYQTIGDYSAAVPLYRRALAIREAAFGKDSPRVGGILNNLAALLTTTGDYAGALPLAERSLALKEKTLGPEHPQVASSLTNLGDVLTQTGDLVRARQVFERALAIWEKALGPDHPDVAASRNNLAELLRRGGEFAAARALYGRALESWEKAYGPEHERVAIALQNLGELARESGDLLGARAQFERAVAVREKVLAPNHPETVESVASLARTLAGLGDIPGATKAFDRAIAMLGAAFGPDHPGNGPIEEDLALLFARTGARERALDLALRAEGVSRDHLRLTGRSLAEDQALRYAAVRAGGLDLALTLTGRGLPGAERAFDALVRSRAIVLDGIAARHHSVVASRDPAIVGLSLDLTRARERLAHLTVRGLGSLGPDAYRALLDEARTAKEEAERALAAASAEFARERELGRVGLSDVVAALPAGSALVSFVRYDEPDLSAPGTRNAPVPFYAALVARAGAAGAPVLVRIGRTATIDPLVARWKREAAQGALRVRGTPAQVMAAYRDAGRALRVAAWDPLAKALAGVDRVFIVPDGTLNLVSFAALPAPGAKGRYLVETGPVVHYLSAERDVVALRDLVRRGSGLLALGGPDFDTSGAPLPCDRIESTGTSASGRSLSPAADGPAARIATRGGCGDFDTLRFDALPGAARETAPIVTLWNAPSGTTPAASPRGSALELNGAAASEHAFRCAAPGRRVLHLATHGFFLGGDCGEVGGSRGLKVVDVAPKTSMKGLSPLLLSGLALAGANRRADAASGTDDGILTAVEIAALDLTGVEWAVLSACDTGVGEVKTGEGVFGLRRAMQVAGVRTLVMSLWPVDDDATRTFMDALYRARLAENLDSPDALRAAGRAVLRARRAAGQSTHPFYWGAFVAAGDWR